MRCTYGKWLAMGASMFVGSADIGAAADPVNGERIARRWCAACHVVTNTQKQASDAVPTFADISRSQRFDEASLAAFLAAPHDSRMLDLSLSHFEIIDLVAYIKRQSR